MKKSIILSILFAYFSIFNSYSQLCIYWNQFNVADALGCSGIAISFYTPCQSSVLVRISIQRSVDSNNWIEIKGYSGSDIFPGTSLNQHYVYTDPNPLSIGGISPGDEVYYRLRFQSGDGYEDLSSTRLKYTLPNCNSYLPQDLCNGNLQMVGVGDMTECGGPSFAFTIGTTVQTTNWTSSNPSIATFSNSSGKILLTPLSTGTVTITATQPVCNKTDTRTITVYACDPCTSNRYFVSGTIPNRTYRNGHIYAGTNQDPAYGIVTISSTQTTNLLAAIDITLTPEFYAVVSGTGSFQAKAQSCQVAKGVSFNKITNLRPNPMTDSAIFFKRQIPIEFFNDYSNSRVKMYPNPTFDNLNILVDSNEEKYTIRVIDNIGVVIKKLDPTTSNKHSFMIQLDLKDLQSGLYFIQVINSIGQMTTQKIIKK